MDITLNLAFGLPMGQEWILIGVGLLVLFGAKKLPELARGMGEGMREFKKAVKDINVDDDATTTSTTTTGASPAQPAPAQPAPAQVAQTPAPDSPEDVESRIVK